MGSFDRKQAEDDGSLVRLGKKPDLDEVTRSRREEDKLEREGVGEHRKESPTQTVQETDTGG